MDPSAYNYFMSFDEINQMCFDSSPILLLSSMLCFRACHLCPNKAKMELFIVTLTGTAFELRVSPNDTVMSIKSKIQRFEGTYIRSS